MLSFSKLNSLEERAGGIVGGQDPAKMGAYSAPRSDGIPDFSGELGGGIDGSDGM